MGIINAQASVNSAIMAFGLQKKMLQSATKIARLDKQSLAEKVKWANEKAHAEIQNGVKKRWDVDVPRVVGKYDGPHQVMAEARAKESPKIGKPWTSVSVKYAVKQNEARTKWADAETRVRDKYALNSVRREVQSKFREGLKEKNTTKTVDEARAEINKLVLNKEKGE